jgi:hypothetical protein
MEKNHLYIVANDYFLTRFLLDSIAQNPSIVVHTYPKSSRGIFNSLKKFLDIITPSINYSHFLTEKFRSALRQIQPDDSVLIFGIDNLKDLRLLRKFINSEKISIFLWNSIHGHKGNAQRESEKIKNIKKIGNTYTFDSSDSQLYNLNLTSQVYRNVDTYIATTAKEINWDVFFVGQDKGRIKALLEWKKKFTELGLRTNIIVTKDHHSSYSFEELDLVSHQEISYTDNIRLILQSLCLLEIVQQNQTGPSIRFMECLFFNKKLITNNLLVAQMEFYHPSRIFIIGKDSLDNLKDFLAIPCTPIPDGQLAPYEFVNWCQQFAQSVH